MSQRPEYWRWTEGVTLLPCMDWRSADAVTLGVDVGSVSTEAVLCLDGALYAWNTIRTGASSPGSAREALSGLVAATGLDPARIGRTVGTGYGRVNVPFADRAVTEIACHGLGAHYLGGPTVRTILDMGGQDCKAIRIDENGRVVNFLMNDKCAAGTGRGMEVLADLLEVPVTELGKRSFETDGEPPAVSDVCVVFARSEAMARLKEGWSKNKVIASYCRAMAERVAALLVRVGVEKDLFVTGGISKNPGVVSRIEEILGLKALVPGLDSQIAGALGAALFAHRDLLKNR